MIRIGIIGMDSTHAVEFTRILHAVPNPRARVVAACAGQATDFPLSVSRRETIGRTLRDSLGLPLLSSAQALLDQVDAVMLLSCDGRCHRSEILPLLPAGKPIFVDKPLCADWREAADILRAARIAGTPCFSASALRYGADLENAKALLQAGPAQIECWVPRLSEPGHPDLSWQGIHGVESAYALLGPGCQTVHRDLTHGNDTTTGVWKDGSEVRIHRSTGDAGREFLTQITSPAGKKIIRGHHYENLLKTIVTFFESRHAPVAEREMIEVLAFIAAADEGRDAHGGLIDLPKMIASLER